MSFEQVLLRFIELHSYERFIGMGVGALSIVLGFILFKSGIETSQSAIAKIGDYEFKFLKVAPGVFFSLFGVLLVGYITYAHPTLENIKSAVSNTSNPGSTPTHPGQTKIETRISAGFSDAEYDELIRLAKPINTAKEIIQLLPKEAIEGIGITDGKSSFGRLVQAVNSLRMELDSKIFNSLPPQVFSACSGKGTMPNEYTQDICVRLKELKEQALK